jgi:acyl-coenzyme A synthetase/AMP-(fatty) acid ligase
VVPTGDERPEAGALIEHVASELTPHKRPREIRFVDSLPRNAMGKVQKRKL